MRVLVTGANGNLGRAMVRLARERGHEVLAVSRSGKDVVHANLEHPMGRARVFHSVQEPLDLVVCAHGINQPNQGVEAIEDMVRNHVASTGALIWMLHQGQKLTSGSLVVLCSSIQATTPRKGRLAYAVAKAALEGLGRALAVELAPRVRVVTLRLGHFTRTMKGVHFGESEREQLKERALLPWIPPDEIADFILGLYKVQSMTGCVIDYDSGQQLNTW